MKLSFPEVATSLLTLTVAEAAVVLRTDIKTIRHLLRKGVCRRLASATNPPESVSRF